MLAAHPPALYKLTDMKHLVPAFALLLLSATAAMAQAPVEQRAPVYGNGYGKGDYGVKGPSASGSSSSPVALSPTATADGQTRLDALEEELRQLRGQLEQQGYTIEQLRRDLEQARSTPPAPQPATSMTGQTGGGAPQPLVSGSSAGATSPASATSPQTTAASPGGTLPGSAATDSYSAAFGLLQQGNYAAAEQAFQGFLQAKPKDPLAGNAQYWLAETFYVRQDFTRAAQEFLKGYQGYPSSSKAPDSLLKLALSLSALKQTEQACRTLDQLVREYPALSRTLSDRAAQEQQKLACS
jgi:tol-pal system protein YbgF